jgi:hypothetical protein
MKWVSWATALTRTFMLPMEANGEHNPLLPLMRSGTILSSPISLKNLPSIGFAPDSPAGRRCSGAFHRAIKLKADPASFRCLLLGSQMLDYAGLVLGSTLLITVWEERRASSSLGT